MNGCTEIFVKHGTGAIGTLLRTTANSYEIRAGQMDSLDLLPHVVNPFYVYLDRIFKSKANITTILISDFSSAIPPVKKFINDLISTQTFYGKRIPDQVVFIKVNYI